MGIDLEAFLLRFAGVTELSEIRQLDVYEYPDLSEEVLVKLSIDAMTQLASVENWDSLHRFFKICIQYLYRDLRSSDALLNLVESSIASPEIFGCDGCNALGALSLVGNELPKATIDHLSKLCHSALDVPVLANNASRFLKEVVRNT